MAGWPGMYVGTAIIRMYAKCGCMPEARRMFDSIQKPDVVCWNALLSGYAENGEGQTALAMLSRMKSYQCKPDSATYTAALKACTSLALSGETEEGLLRGRQLHSEIGPHRNRYVENTLIDMYGKCGSMKEARSVFDALQKPDAISWNALLLGYAENGEGREALNLFLKMKAAHCEPNSVTYIAALKSCTSLALSGEKEYALQRGRQIHAEAGGHLNLYIQNTLIVLYAKCGNMEDARAIFVSIRKPDVIAWNALILGYAENGEGRTAMDLFFTMKARHGFEPTPATYVAAIKGCTCLAVNGDSSAKEYGLETGRQIHSEIGHDMEGTVVMALIDMYSKCGNMTEARRIFDGIRDPAVVLWNAVILGYAENGEGRMGLDLFDKMKAKQECRPDSVTYIAALKACASLGADSVSKQRGLERGREIHSKVGSLMNPHVEATLVCMYSKCGSLVEARRVFDSVHNPDVVAWTALVLAYAENGEGEAAMDLLLEMKATTACEPDAVAYIAALKSCGLTGALALGRKLHADMNDFTPHVVTCLIDFYAKCGSMAEACEVFDLHPRARHLPAWNVLIAGYGSFGVSGCVLDLCDAMQDSGLQPDSTTLMCVLLCCSHAGLVSKSREYFEAIPARYGVVPDVMHYTCMVDVLGRANQVDEAIQMIHRMPCSPDVVTWMTLLGACCKWRNVEAGRWAFESLLEMDKKDSAAFVLMAQLYASCSMWEEQQSVLKMKNAYT